MSFITAIAMWHDEAFSGLLIRYPWHEMMERIILDVHPPLYYILLRLWSYVFGQGLLSLRGFSLAFALLAVWACYKFVHAAFGSRNVAVLAALALALNPFQFQYAVEARMYTLGTALALYSSYLLTRALDNRRYWVWYGVAVAGMLYTHYYLAFTVAAQGLFILLCLLRRREIKTIFRAAGAYIVAAVLYIPWLPSLLQQINRVESGYWIPPMDRFSIPGTVWKMAFGGPGAGHAYVLSAAGVAGLLLLYFLRRVSNFNKWHVALGLVIPFAGAVILSLRSNIYLDRYFVFAGVYFVILLMLTITHLPKAILRWSGVALLLVFSVYATLKNNADLHAAERPGMAAAARYFNSEVAARDKIYAGSSFVYFTFKYYNETAVPALLYSTEPLEKIPHFSGTALLSERDLVMDLPATPRGATVWYLWTTGYGGRRTVVPANWKLQEEKSWGDTPAFKGDIYVTKYKVN